MEPKHRQRIDLLCDLVVRQVDIKALWTYLSINTKEYLISATTMYHIDLKIQKIQK